MDRFTHNGYAMVKNDDGRYVLHADHAAELAEWKQRAERAEAYVAGQDVRSDFRTAADMRAALEHARAELARVRAEAEDRAKLLAELRADGVKAMADLKSANALLRAECEKRRVFLKFEMEEGLPHDDPKAWARAYCEAEDALAQAMKDTDAAGALKGVE